jgi:enoyl-CoA hydratase/carnithine racemase
MEFVRHQLDSGVLCAILARGKANAINAAFMCELEETVARAAAPDVDALVLASATPGFFSAGFDIGEVFGYSRPQMDAFFRRFVGVYTALRALPKPVVAALSGHTFAGGSILALGCDIRVMARGEFGFALSEINLGLVLTDEIRSMLVEAVGVGRARELLLSGDPVSPERAYEIGLVHELADAGAVVDCAVARARRLAAKPKIAFAEMNRSLRGGAAPDPSEIDRFLDLWFSEEGEQARRAVASRIRK